MKRSCFPEPDVAITILGAGPGGNRLSVEGLQDIQMRGRNSMAVPGRFFRVAALAH